MHWWMYLAYSAADDVASTLAAMAKVGSVVGSLKTVGGPAAWALAPRRGTIHKPVLVHLCPHTYYRPAAIYNGAIDFCEGHCAPRVAHSDNREKGVGCQAGDYMDCSCADWEIWKV